jgi:uncharacterized phage protein gp47/JayE
MPLTPDGYIGKTLLEIKTEIEEDIVARFGEVNLEPDSVFGQLVGIFSLPTSQLYQDIEDVYFSMYRATAEGDSLDNSVQLIGITRLEATSSRVTAKVTGDQGTLIPAGTQVEVAETGELFESPQDGTITRSAAIEIIAEVTTVQDGQDYTVVINGDAFTFNSGIGATAESIAAGVVSEINSGGEPVTATDNLDGTFAVNADDNDVVFNSVVSANITINSRSSIILFEAVDTGPIQVLTGTFTDIVTPVAGWDSVTNLDPAVQGRERETDDELRLRADESIRVIGAASLSAIRARLRQEVQDVTAVFIFENRQPFEVDGRPAHSFETVIVGGDDNEIAEKIFEIKPAGIQTFGNVTVNVEDSNGDLQAVSFSRPEPVYVWVDVELTVLPGQFPVGGITAVRNAILAYGQTLNVGDDVIYQEFFGDIYETAGIVSVLFTIATSATPAGPPGAYTEANLTIDEVEVSNFDLDRINVGIA